ncbi:acid-sensing ion channel 4-A-like [Saccostrea echinata]|uniref:acid-sensing ion channel 4-A-like n=1 Tax=Saccostrea echinata TaxID=191078 RepID=UPI002A811071|nr:acid-sensing ion channel 4-A-like [Saccostrea echinata]
MNNKRKQDVRKISPHVFHVSEKKNEALPEPEIVDVPMVNVDEKKICPDDGNIQELWNDFRDNTTMHGLKNANLRQRHRLRCAIWAIALLAMGSFLVYTTYQQFTNYFKYPTISNTHVQTQSSVKFPAVTLCSASSLKREALPKILNLEYFLLTESVIGDFFPRLNLSQSEYSDYHLPRNASWVNETSNKVEDLFLYCFFEGEQKECQEVMKPIVTKLGVCYTFNSREYVEENNHIVTSRTGSSSGLQLYLKVDQHNFVFNDIMAAGIKVVIHDQNEEPDVVDKGFMISPGFSTFASIHKTEYHYLPSPYKINGDQFCLDTKSTGFTNPLTLYDVYSKSACMMECKQNHVIKLCGCRSPFDKANETICSLAQMSTCYDVESEKFDKNSTAQHLCTCPIECEYSEYYARLSTGYFPAMNYQLVLSQMGFTNFRDTFMELAVYFESLGYLKVEQVPEYSFGDIVGILGGQMGIFLGASLLTLTELMEFILLSSLVVSKRVYKRVSKK